MDIALTLMWSRYKFFSSTDLYMYDCFDYRWKQCDNTIHYLGRAKQKCVFENAKNAPFRPVSSGWYFLRCPMILLANSEGSDYTARIHCASAQCKQGLRCSHMPEYMFSYNSALLIAWNIRYSGENWYKQVLFTVIIPTKQAFNYFTQFDWPRAIRKLDLHFDKSNEQ